MRSNEPDYACVILRLSMVAASENSNFWDILLHNVLEGCDLKCVSQGIFAVFMFSG